MCIFLTEQDGTEHICALALPIITFCIVILDMFAMRQAIYRLTLPEEMRLHVESMNHLGVGV